MSGLQVDMSGMPAGVVEEFRKGRVAREALAVLKAPENQVQHAREWDGTNRSIDGVGRLRMVVTGDAFHYWGRRLGYECWQDRQFLREYERDNESVRVKCGGTKLQVGYAPTAKRFSKKYGND